MVLPDATLFPGATYPLEVQKPSHIKMVTDVLEGHRVLILAYEEPLTKKPSKVCGIGLIRAAIRVDGVYRIILQGLTRVSLVQCIRKRPYLIYEIQPLKEGKPPYKSTQMYLEMLREKVDMIIKKMKISAISLPSPPSSANTATAIIPAFHPQSEPKTSFSKNPLEDFLAYLNHIDQPGTLADIIGSTMVIPGPNRQAILNACSIRERLKITTEILCKTYGLE